MKDIFRVTLSIIIFSVSISGFGQSTLSIGTGQFNNHQFPSIPQRQIEYIEDGIIVTYSIDNVLSLCDISANGAFDWLIPGFTNLRQQNMPSVPVRTDVFTIPFGYIWQVTLIEEEHVDYEVATKAAPCSELGRCSEAHNAKMNWNI